MECPGSRCYHCGHGGTASDQNQTPSRSSLRQSVIEINRGGMCQALEVTINGQSVMGRLYQDVERLEIPVDDGGSIQVQVVHALRDLH